MTNKSPHTILASARIAARPLRNGRSRPSLEVDETLLQTYYDGLALDPQKWGIILKTAYEYASDFHPDWGVDPTRWWSLFRGCVRQQVEGENLSGWALQYPQIEGSICSDGSICHARADQAKYSRSVA